MCELQNMIFFTFKSVIVPRIARILKMDEDNVMHVLYHLHTNI